MTINYWSHVIQKNETVLWQHNEERGIFQKYLAKSFVISTERIFIYDFKQNRMIGLLTMKDLDEVVVTSSYRSYNSQRYGMYSSYARGMGVSGGQSVGQSQTVGTILFFSKGQPIISIGGVTDPFGLKRLVVAFKKSIREKIEVKLDDSLVSSASICMNCKARNQQKSNYCHKCGRVLR